MLPIIAPPNPILSTKAKSVTKVDKDILDLIKQMEESLNFATDPIGVGLAAPPVAKNLAIFFAKPTEKTKLQVFINPNITKIEEPTGKAKGKTRKLEGCLSLYNIWGEVERAKAVWLDYMDETGKQHHKKFNGFIANIIQHEVDHLNGILFPKRVLERSEERRV